VLLKRSKRGWSWRPGEAGRTRSLAAALLGLAVAAAGVPAPARSEVVNRVVLRVNDRIATLYDYAQRKADLQAQLLHQQEMPLDQRRDMLNHLGVTVFHDMFEEMLLLSRADQADVQVSDEDIAAAIQRMRQNFKLDTDEEFAAALAQNGMSPTQLRDQIRQNLTIQTLISREVQGKIEVDEEVLRRYYRDHPDEFRVPEQLRLQEVVVLDDSKLTAEERVQLAAAIRQEVIAGRPLAELAAEHSKDGSTSALIEVGWVSHGDLSADLEAAVWGLKVGEVSAPVAARGGLHLLRVEERREATLRPFADVIDGIRAKERERLFTDQYKEYMDRLEREAYVQIDPPDDAKDFRLATAGPGDLASTVGLNAATAEQAAATEKTKAATAAAAAAARTRAAEPNFPSPEAPGTPPPSQIENRQKTPEDKPPKAAPPPPKPPPSR
jgi:peptidyl-prolyl cis-trans isomerase SurA